MPELPEVETVCRGLNQLTLDKEILGGDVLLSRTIAHPISVVDFLAKLQGMAIARWHRRGKYLLAELFPSHLCPIPPGNLPTPDSGWAAGEPRPYTTPDSKGWLGVHLRMSGQLLWLHRDAPLQKHTRVRLFFAGDRELRFVDQRTFGKMWLAPFPDPASIITGLQQLGEEPFSPEFSVEYLAHKLHGRRRAVKTALLDQAIVAGVGNIYADEALFLSGVPPALLCTDLTSKQIERLHSSIIQVLQNAIDAGGTTFSNFLNVHGVNGNYAGVAWVYNRAGSPCRVCGEAVQRLKLAGRSTHFCPGCQR